MYVVNGSDGRCIVAVRLIVGVRYLERPLREVLLYIYRQRGQLNRLGSSLRSQLKGVDVEVMKVIQLASEVHN